MRHLVDPNTREIESDDLATWLLFFLESHGADVTLRPDHTVRVNLDSMVGLNAETIERWAPIIAKLIPDIRAILVARTELR